MNLTTFYEAVESTALIEQLKSSSFTEAELCQIILDNTVAYYGADPQNRRGIIEEPQNGTEEDCQYVNAHFTKACAVGRLLNPDTLNYLKRESDFNPIDALSYK